MFLGTSAFRRHRATRIRRPHRPKSAIAKTRYLPQLILYTRAFHASPVPDSALRRPPVDRMPSNRFSGPRTDVLLTPGQNFSNSEFHNSSKFLRKCDFVSQTRISDLWGDLRTPGRPQRDLGVLSLDSPSNSPQFLVFGGHADAELDIAGETYPSRDTLGRERSTQRITSHPGVAGEGSQRRGQACPTRATHLTRRDGPRAGSGECEAPTNRRVRYCI